MNVVLHTYISIPILLINFYYMSGRVGMDLWSSNTIFGLRLRLQYEKEYYLSFINGFMGNKYNMRLFCDMEDHSMFY